MRFTGIDLHANPYASFGKVQEEVFQWPLFLFYVVGLIAASWHFAYGIWLFCAKWGIVTGEVARKRFLIACIGFFFLLSAVGLASLATFRSEPLQMMEPGTAATATPTASPATSPTATQERPVR